MLKFVLALALTWSGLAYGETDRVAQVTLESAGIQLSLLGSAPNLSVSVCDTNHQKFIFGFPAIGAQLASVRNWYDKYPIGTSAFFTDGASTNALIVSDDGRILLIPDIQLPPERLEAYYNFSPRGYAIFWIEDRNTRQLLYLVRIWELDRPGEPAKVFKVLDPNLSSEQVLDDLSAVRTDALHAEPKASEWTRGDNNYADKNLPSYGLRRLLQHLPNPIGGANLSLEERSADGLLWINEKKSTGTSGRGRDHLIGTYLDGIWQVRDGGQSRGILKIKRLRTYGDRCSQALEKPRNPPAKNPLND